MLDHGAASLTGAPEVLCCQVVILPAMSPSCALQGQCLGQRQNSEAPRVQETVRALRQRRGPGAVLDHGKAWLTGALEVIYWQVVIVQVTSKLSCSLRIPGPGQRRKLKTPRVQSACFGENYLVPIQSATDTYSV